MEYPGEAVGLARIKNLLSQPSHMTCRPTCFRSRSKHRSEFGQKIQGFRVRRGYASY